VQVAYEVERDQAESVLRRIVQTKGCEGTRSQLEPALRRIRRYDIIRRCLYTTTTEEEWTWIMKKAVAADMTASQRSQDEGFTEDGTGGVVCSLLH